MSNAEQPGAYRALALSTVAFTSCFALWMLNGVLVTHLVDKGLFNFDEVEVGWLLGIPVLTGSILRLPVGMLADRWGGRLVYSGVLLAAALGALLLAQAHSFFGFVIGSLGFGLAGTSFAVGVVYTSTWFSKARQGTALGIFGAGNAGSALATIFTPKLLEYFTHGGQNPEGWRSVPLAFAGLMLFMAVAFFALAKTPAGPRRQTPALGEQLRTLKSVRVWRFGLYYFLVFGCFVALAQWLVPYYTGVFGTSLATAGLLAAVFSFPSGVIRALGGYLTDRFGARITLYAVFAVCSVCCLLLSIPRMEISTPGESVVAKGIGTVTAVTPSAVVVGTRRYELIQGTRLSEPDLLPLVGKRQEPAVHVGDTIKRKQVLARGTTTLRFAPNIYLFTGLVFLVGIAMGIGKAAVYRFIPDYFPGQVGTVGGLVGVIGGLGGFVGPILFGYLLRATGLWSSAWLFMWMLSFGCLAWLHMVALQIEKRQHARAPLPLPGVLDGALGAERMAS